MIQGKVYLTGAGPGDPGLITLRAAEVLKLADVVIYDGLVNPTLLQLCARAEKIPAARRGSLKNPRLKHGADQVKINRWLVRYARQGKMVVRLKGGDPFIFGRGGEEAFYLKQHGVSFEIIPGVSAANAVPAYAGIPVTDRRFASSVTFVTCHEDPAKEKSGLDWEALARVKGTLVFFMGVRNLKAVTEILLRYGRAPATPAAVIEWGTLPEQRVVEGTLKTLAAKAVRAGLGTPALTIVGDVVHLRRQLNWFERRPLFGRHILVTRPESQSARLCAALRDQGAFVHEFAAIRIAPPKSYARLDRALSDLKRFDAVIFTSMNAVDSFFGRLEAAGKDARALAGLYTAAVGESTARRLEENGVRPDLVPKYFHAEQLIRELKKRNVIRGRHYLLPCADIAPPSLGNALKDGGGQVTRVTAYRTLSNPQERKQLEELLKHVPMDAVLFASASAARQFFQRLSKPLCATIKDRLVSIGPVTSEALRKLGFRPKWEARQPTIESLVNSLIRGSGKKRKKRA